MNLSARIERWPWAGAFTTSRASKPEAVVIVVELDDGIHRGRGEAVPYARYGEVPELVLDAIEALRPAVERGLDRAALQTALPAGAARNALDCAYWDLAAKQSGRRVHELAGLGAPSPVNTAYTISLGSVAEMSAAAERSAWRPLLKVKLGGEDDAQRIAAVRRVAPRAELIVDANGGWSADNVAANFAACADAAVTLVEQPLPQGADELLRNCEKLVRLCADDSFHDCASLASLAGK